MRWLFAVVLGFVSVAHAAVQAPDGILFNAIAQVESGGNPQRTNAGEDAVGIVQIRRVVVDDCNRIVGHTVWTYADRYSVTHSREMFDVYLRYYGDVMHRAGRAVTYETLARIWNGGPTGPDKPVTLSYWKRVEREMHAGDRVTYTVSHLYLFPVAQRHGLRSNMFTARLKKH